MNIVRRFTGVLLSLAVLLLSVQFPLITAFAGEYDASETFSVGPITYIDRNGYCTGYGYGSCSNKLSVRAYNTTTDYFHPSGAPDHVTATRPSTSISLVCTVCGYTKSVGHIGTYSSLLENGWVAEQCSVVHESPGSGELLGNYNFNICRNNTDGVVHTAKEYEVLVAITPTPSCGCGSSSTIHTFNSECSDKSCNYGVGPLINHTGHSSSGCTGSWPYTEQHIEDHFRVTATNVCSIHGVSSVHYYNSICNGYVTVSCIKENIYKTCVKAPIYKCAYCNSRVAGKHKALQTSSITGSNTTKTYGDAAFSPFTVTGPTPTYISSNTGVATISSTGSVTIVGAGTTTLTATIAENSSWTASSKSITLTVNKKSVTPTNVSASAITYGQTLASSTITGTCSVTGTYSWSAPTTAPSVTNSNSTAYGYVFTPSNSNYNTYAGSVKLTVNKANPTMTSPPSRLAITYGQTLASSTFSGGAVTPTGSWAWQSPNTVPVVSTTNTYNAVYTPSDTTNYNSLIKSFNLTVNKATPAIYAAPTAGAITYGQTLASSALSGGSASVAGRFEWESPATAPAAGTFTYTCRFVPNDTANFNTVTGISVSVNIRKATPVITGGLSTTPITYGQILSSSAITGNSNVPGTFSFVNGSVTPTVPDSNVTSYAVTFRPNDTTNYNTVSGLTAKVIVNKKVPNVQGVSFTTTPITYGQQLSASSITVNGSAEVAGTWNWTLPTKVPDIYDTIQQLTFYPNDSVNYANASSTTTITINKATIVPTALTASAITYEQSLASSTITGSCPIGGTYTWDNTNIYPSVADSNTTLYALTFTPSDLARYNVVTGLTCSLPVGKLTPEVTAAMLSSITASEIIYGQTLGDSTLSGSTPREGHYEWVDTSYVPTVGGTAQPIKFVPNDTANYNESSGFTFLPNVAKATPTVNSDITTTPITYGESLSSSIISADTSVPGSWSWKNVNTYPIVADSNSTEYEVVFTPNDTTNYNTVERVAKVQVNKATPVIDTVSVFGSAITYGQTLGNSTLSGSADVTGTFKWEDSTIMPSVTDSNVTMYSVTFTPDDTNNYNIVYDIMIGVQVNKATPTVVTPVSASGIIYEDSLQSSSLSGKMSVPGTFTWCEPSICPSVPDSETTYYGVLFTPDDSINYSTVDLSTTIHVDKKTPAFTDEQLATINATAITYHDTLSMSTITGASYVGGTFVWDEPTIQPTVPDSNTTHYAVTFIPSDEVNYNRVSGLTCTLTVNKYIQPVDPSVVTTTSITYGDTLNDSTLGGTPPIPGTFVWKDTTIAPSVPDSNSTSYEVIFYPDDDVNHLPTEGILVKVKVNKADISFTQDEIDSIRASEITFNDTLAESVITSTTIIPGHFVWADTTIAPYVADSDTTQYGIVFKPDDFINYNDNSSLTTTVRVNKAIPVINEYDIIANTITYGQTLGDSSLSGTSPIPGRFTWVNPTIKPVVLDSGVTRYQVQFTPTDLDNYLPNDNLYTTLTINKAQAVISLDDISTPYSKRGFQLNGTTNSEGAISYSVTENENMTVTADGMVTMLKIGSQSIAASVPETDNFLGTTTAITFEITPAIANMDGTSIYNLFEYSDDFTLDVTTDIEGGTLTYTSQNDKVSVDDEGNVTINKVGMGLINVHLDATGTNYQSADFFVQINIRPDSNKDGIPDTGMDLNGDGIPDINVDIDGDFYPDSNIDLNGDLVPDISIDTDRDGKPDVNIDTNRDNIADTNVDIDGDNIPDLSIDTDGDGIRDYNIDDNHDGIPELNVDTDNDGKPDANVDLNGDFVPDINIDINGDNKPDINIDTDNDNKPDVNIDTNSDNVPNVNVDTDGDLVPDVNVDWDNDGYPDTNIANDGTFTPSINLDGNHDGVPELNIDLDGDLKPDINIDTDHDNLSDVNVDLDGNNTPDINIDTDGDYKPDVNIDIDLDNVPDLNIDIDGDNTPDTNVDTNGDGVRDLNIDTDNDGDPDVNIDLDKDNTPDINIDKDNDERPDVNIDVNRDNKPDFNIDTNNDGEPDLNIDINKDGISDLNTDVDGDGIPDLDIDNDGDRVPDVNIDLDNDGKADVNVDTDNDGKPDINIDDNDDNEADINVDVDGDGTPDINIDTNNDNKPDINIDTDKDGTPDINIDTDKDGLPNINIDTDKDNKPDVNIDIDNDSEPDTNIDTDGDNKPDINIDTNNDNKPDANVDLDNDNKPDINIDTDGDNTPDVDIDTTGDGKPDTNVDTDGDGKPDININNGDDSLNTNIDVDGDSKPDINIDLNGDGTPDLNIDINGDLIPDINIDIDCDLMPDINIDINCDLKPDINIDADGDLQPDTNIDADNNTQVDIAEVKVEEEIAKVTVDKPFSLEAEPVVTENMLTYTSLNDVLDVTDEGVVTINHAGTGQILIKSVPVSGTFAVSRMMYANPGTEGPVLDYDVVDGKIVTIEVEKATPEESGGSASSLSVTRGKTLVIKDGVNSNNKRTYSSSDTNVAKVSDNGVVTGISVGTTAITVTIAGDDTYKEVVKTYTIEVKNSSTGGGSYGGGGGGHTRPSKPTTDEPSKPSTDNNNKPSTPTNEVTSPAPEEDKSSSTVEVDDSDKWDNTIVEDEEIVTPEKPEVSEQIPDVSEEKEDNDEEVKYPFKDHSEPQITDEEVKQPSSDQSEPTTTEDTSTEESDNQDKPVEESSNDPVTALPPTTTTEDKEDEENSDPNGGGGSKGNDEYDNPNTGIHAPFLGTALAAALSLVLTIKRRKTK